MLIAKHLEFMMDKELILFGGHSYHSRLNNFQTRPVPFTVHAIVTNSDLEFDITDIDFGHCTIYESVKASVKLTNRSILPQEFGFMNIPAVGISDY